MGEFQPVVQEIERDGEVFLPPALEITPNLLGDLETATLEVARELAGKKFVKDLALDPDTAIWSLPTFNKIEEARQDRTDNTDEAPASLADLIIDRAAELQHGKKPRKSLGKKVLSSLQVKESDSKAEDTETADTESPRSLEGLENWPVTDNAVKKLLAHEAQNAALKERVSKDINRPFDDEYMNGTNGRIIEDRIMVACIKQVEKSNTEARKQAAEGIFQEVLATAGPDRGSGHHDLHINKDNALPVATLLSMVAYARTSTRRLTYDFPAETEKVASDIKGLEESNRDLVFSKVFGVAVKDNFRLSMHDSERTIDDYPQFSLSMKVLSQRGYDNPRELAPAIHDIWNSYKARDINSLSDHIDNSEVQPIYDDVELSDILGHPDGMGKFGKIDESMATLAAHYAGRLDEMPKLSRATEYMLQADFQEKTLRPILRKLYSMSINFASAPPRVLREIEGVLGGTSYQMNIAPEATDEARQLHRQLLERLTAQDPELVQADLKLRGITPDNLQDLLVDNTDGMLVANIHAQDEQYLTAYSDALQFAAKNIFGQAFDFKDYPGFLDPRGYQNRLNRFAQEYYDRHMDQRLGDRIW